MAEAEPSVPNGRQAGEALLIDRLLPTFDVTVFNHVVVDAGTEQTYRSVRQLDLIEVAQTSRLIRALFALRGLPELLVASVRQRDTPPGPASLPLAGDGEGIPGWSLLGERPGRELVVGAIGRFWTPSIEWLEVPPEAFPSFDEPGFGKIAWSFSVLPYGETRSLVTNECRTRTTDPLSRQRFLRYWRLIGPFAGYVMACSLPVIKAHSEAATGRSA